MAARDHDLVAPALRDLDAVAFDTDGVITDSPRLHAAAWKSAFDAFPGGHPPDDPQARRPFDIRDDYLTYVDGRSRRDGAALLASRGIDPTDATVRAVAENKERLFTRRLREQGVDVHPGTVRLGLVGKPDPGLFLEAVRRLGAEPTPAAAGERLRRHGADIVVLDPGERGARGAPR